MSGPCTAILTPAQVLPVLLAASAIRAGRAVSAAQDRANALHAEHAVQRHRQAGRQALAAAHGLQALQQAAQTQRAETERLSALAAQLGAADALTRHRPAPPPALASAQDWATYVTQLEAYVAEARQALLAVLAQMPHAPAGAPDSIDIDAALRELAPAADVAKVAVQPGPPARRSERLLARVAALGALPPAIAALAQALDAAPTDERADLLASELRLQLQRHAEQALQAQLRAAQAEVLQQSLLDLGYEVEGFDDTLFVQGGVVHFRRRGWGDYMVRLRVAESAASLNFNVVRAVDDVAGEVSIEDHLAEDRWCAEFPALQKALAARGLPIEVTRQLQAGEVPVQRVLREHLPRFADDEESARRTDRLRARDLP